MTDEEGVTVFEAVPVLLGVPVLVALGDLAAVRLPEGVLVPVIEAVLLLETVGVWENEMVGLAVLEKDGLAVGVCENEGETELEAVIDGEREIVEEAEALATR